jgi:N6-adenosine-specific RNA methylase IME4
MDVSPQAGQYRVIYADPPWRFATYSDKGKGRSAEAHYDCLSIEQIKAIPVRDWVADDAVLLLWATDPLLPRALEVIEAWGLPIWHSHRRPTPRGHWPRIKKPYLVAQ